MPHYIKFLLFNIEKQNYFSKYLVINHDQLPHLI